jgi:shikimate kinase/nicotinic acid mononucleotide adenylyltransferase
MAEEKKDKKSNKPLNNNQIEINPQLQEEGSKKVVISFGRMNPPTVGHEKLINKVKEVARKIGAKAEVYLSHSQDAKKNPLSYDDKIMIAKEAFGSLIQHSAAKTLIDVMKLINNKYDDVTLIAGADRVPEFDTLLKKYNGKEYHFKSIAVVSAGERDPDAEGVEGMSASKMREAAMKGEKDAFKSGLPKNLQKHADDVYDMVRGGMKLSEETELDEYVLTLPERQKRALVFRRYERKIEAARERMRGRIADNQHLISRARKKAIEVIRKKVAGAKGLDYANLSPGEKMMIDKRVEQRKGAIAKIAAKLLPVVRKSELQRVAQLHQGPVKEDVNASFENYIEESKRFHMAFGKDGKPKYDRRFRAFRHIVKKEEANVDLINMIAELHDVAEVLSLQEVKEINAIVEKSVQSGIDFDTLYSIYEDGTGNPFDNVNSFIANYKFEEIMNEGVHDPSIFKAVFLAGGPGSGKSFIVGKTALTALGMKVINSDDLFERALAKAGMKTTPEDIYSPRGQEIRGQAKASTSKLMGHAVDGRLGLVIDGTGKDYDKVEKQATKLKKIGYEVAMIFVNTNLDTALKRNRMRARSLPDGEVKHMWQGVQDNLGKFQNFFGSMMYIIDNSEGSDFEASTIKVHTKIAQWAKKTPGNPAAKSWIADAGRGLKEDRKSFKHELGIGVPFKHIAKDALTHIDTDMDSDVDQYDFNKTVPDETNAVPDVTKKFMKKYAGEKKHSKVGVAFEQTELTGVILGRSRKGDVTVPQVPSAVVPPPSNDGPRPAEKHIDAALERAHKMKKFRAYHESYGAGFEGTDELVQNYKAATPGESGKQNKPKITDGINEAFSSIMEAEESDVEITAAKMKDFEKFVDRMFEKFKIDFEFTKHFGERMNDDRNSPKIKLKELADLIKKIYAKHGNPLKDKPGAEMVVKDLQSDLNMPVVVKYDSKNDEIDIVAKTIMRKKNFATPNPVVKY